MRIPDGLAIECEDDEARFVQFLEYCGVNPFISWESQRDKLASHPDYLLLSSNSARSACFQRWASEKRSQTDSKSEKQKFLDFVRSTYTTGTLYPVFKRKYRSDPQFQCQLADKEKADLFRQFVVFTKLTPEEQQNFAQAHEEFQSL